MNFLIRTDAGRERQSVMEWLDPVSGEVREGFPEGGALEWRSED